MTFDRSTCRGIIAELHRIDPGRRLVAIDLPGHGQTPDRASYELPKIAEQVHRAVLEADLFAPVVVGHSDAGLLATLYAARYPCRGVVNIDSPLQVAPLAYHVRSHVEQLRGPEFSGVWQRPTAASRPAARALEPASLRAANVAAVAEAASTS